ncbi:MAG: acyl-CoA dehydrogenase family protein [Polyangiales bacterium]
MLARLLGDPALHPHDSLENFWAAHAKATAGLSTVERALLGGLHADRLGYAFAAGYRAALSALAPALGDEAVALCATESGGAHPRAIQTTLSQGRLSGHKKWTTLGSRAASLLVVARIGVENERPLLKVVRVPVARDGVRVTPMTDTPFVPEIPHAEVSFENVKIDDSDVLPGDGYDCYLKPFRTIEDLHVHGAVIGYLLSVARRHRLPRAIVEELVALACALPALVAEPPLDPATHVALAGLISATAHAVDHFEPHWATVDAPERDRWMRDRALLMVAGKARAARRETAWERLSRPPAPSR